MSIDATIIEEAIAKYVAVPVETLRGKSRKSACVKARHFSIYFLHNKYGFTGGQLSKLYNTTRHRIFDICNLMDTYRRIDAVYRSELLDVESILDDIVSE